MRRAPAGLCLLVGWSLAAGAGAGDGAEAFLRSRAAEAGQGWPLVRIGLSHEHSLEISGRGSYRVLDPTSGRSVWHGEFRGRLQVVAEGGPREGVPAVYRVQVGAFGERSAAGLELERLAGLTGAEGVVRHDPDRGTWRVRLGRAADRLALGPLVDTLRRAGVQDLWIAEEAAEAPGSVTLRLVDESYASLATGLTRLAVVPAKGGRIAVQGKPYRGLIELRVSPFGTVRAVNWIELEQYLLGVVPAELGPEVWPELAALRAQAVAARTYAWRNRGQFADEGFDLCATPRCQVYGGAGAEHPLSDRAVWATRGEILTWSGEPIVALYTATCGGHTEDGREIFPEHDEPYLRGVPCRAEADAVATLGSEIVGRPIVPLRDETGADATRDATLLAAAGVVDRKAIDPARADRPVGASELVGWTRNLARLAGLADPGEPAHSAGAPTLADAAEMLLARLGWSERARVLLAGEDLPALLRDPDTAALGPAQRRALAYLAWVEAIAPFPDGRFRPERAATAARLAPAMVRIGESYHAFGLKEAVLSGVGRGGVRLVRGKAAIKLPLASEVALFGRSGGRGAPVERLQLWPGDRLRYRTDRTGRIDFLELLPPVKGTSDDRSARVYSWEVRKSRRELEAAVNRRVAIGRLEGLEILRRGVSGRIVELRVVGSRSSAVVRGFDVRRLLDLRESLTVIEPQRDRGGEIEAVVFAGKGWGHGVGLCQVGAYGMALRGADYGAILKHYYHGAKLERLARPR